MEAEAWKALPVRNSGKTAFYMTTGSSPALSIAGQSVGEETRMEKQLGNDSDQSPLNPHDSRVCAGQGNNSFTDSEMEL